MLDSFSFKPSTRQFTHIIMCCSLLLFSALSKADSKIIQVGSDPWCPFICDIDSNHQGLMVDIAKEALALSGFTLNLQIINWARAKKMVQAGSLDGVIGMTLAEGSDDQYYFSNTKLAESQTCFYTRLNDDWEYRSVASLEHKIFGWINNYNYAFAPFNDWIQERKTTKQILTVAGIDTFPRLFKLLALERIDILADDRNVIAFELKNLGLENKIKIAGCLAEIDNVHLAFSLKSEQKEVWAKALKTGIESLRKTGRIDALLAFYGLTQEMWIKSKM